MKNLTVSEAIQELHEIGFKLNEEKNKGCIFVNIADFEELLNWSIDNVTIIRDKYSLE